MEQTWRWFGAADRVTLQDARQAGAEGIVTALHTLSAGEVWPLAQIEATKRAIEAAGMRWAVVESLEVTERIKTRSTGWQRDVENFKESLRRLARCGLDVVAYNFMPVFSWMRTSLRTPLPNGGTTTPMVRASVEAMAQGGATEEVLERWAVAIRWGGWRNRRRWRA